MSSNATESENDMTHCVQKVIQHLSLPARLGDFQSPRKSLQKTARALAQACARSCCSALGKSELADVQFHVNGLWVASAHGSVLSARSAVFGRMLANETEERKSGVIRFDDVTAEGLVGFLEFVYLGTSAARACMC